MLYKSYCDHKLSKKIIIGSLFRPISEFIEFAHQTLQFNFSNVKSWRSLAERDEVLYLTNCHTNLVLALHALSLLFWHFINTTLTTWADTSLHLPLAAALPSKVFYKKRRVAPLHVQNPNVIQKLLHSVVE